MKFVFGEKIKGKSQRMRFGMGVQYEEPKPLLINGHVFFEMYDAETGKELAGWDHKNLITLDAGILAARLFKDSLSPVSDQNNGLTMLAVGTGATGNPLSPDTPQNTQRKLNTEIYRKLFSSTTFRDGDGIAVGYPTHVVDFTTTFSETEAVGALNEMMLLSTYSLNRNETNPINNGPDDYNPALDTTGLDLGANILFFPVVSKPNTAVLSITWRLSF